VYGINDFSALSGEHTCKLMMATYVETLKNMSQMYSHITLDLGTVKTESLADRLRKDLPKHASKFFYIIFINGEWIDTSHSTEQYNVH